MVLISSLMAVSIAKSSQLGMSSTSSNTIAMQANQYAETEAEILRHTNYNDLSSKGKTTIAGSSYSKQIIVGAESVYDSTKNIKQKQCVVSVYKDSEVLPRATLTVTRLSKSESDTSTVPQGTILPWYGKLADIPIGYALCDGTNGTPNLLDRFLVGAGNSYLLGDIGGANEVKLTGTQIGNHYHAVGFYEFGRNNGKFLGFSTTRVFPVAEGTGWIGWNGSNNGGSYSGPIESAEAQQITSLAVATAAQESHENRPPYYALYYIMKL